VVEALNAYLLPTVFTVAAYPLIQLTGSNHVYEFYIKDSISSQLNLNFN